MIKDLDGYDIHTGIRILNRVIELLPVYEFVCHCIDAIERNNEFGIVNNFIIRHIREDIEARLEGHYTYSDYLVLSGQMSDEELSVADPTDLRVKWIRGIISELQQ